MIENLDKTALFFIGSLMVNATMFYTWVVMFLLFVLCYIFTNNLKTKNPGKIQVLLEMMISGIEKQIKDVAEDSPIKYLAIIGTFFLFIAMCNLLSIFPFFKSPTSSLTTTVAFASCVFFAIPYYGIKNAGIKGYFKKFIEPTPVMAPMNIISDFSSCFSLAFRLYGNVLSGVVISSVLMMLVPFIVPIPMQVLGLITGTIQAYIFALLAIVYVSAVAPKPCQTTNDTIKENYNG